MWKKKFHLWTEASVCTGKFHPAFPDALLLQGFQTCIAKPHGHVSLLFAINILKYISLPAVFNRQSTSTILLRGLLLRLKLPGKIDLMSDLFFSRLYFTYRRLNKNETFCILFSQQLFFGKAHMIHKVIKISMSTNCIYKIETPQVSFSTLLISPGTAGPSGGANGKEPACQCRRCKRCGFSPWVGKMPWRRTWQPTPVFLPGGSHGQRSLEGYSSQGHKELDTTEVTQHARQQDCLQIQGVLFLWLSPG